MKWHFDSVLTRVRAELHDTEGDEQAPANTFYCPILVEYMMHSVMELAPLWSQLLSDHVVTNAEVEWFMKVIKNSCFEVAPDYILVISSGNWWTTRRFERKWSPFQQVGLQEARGGADCKALWTTRRSAGPRDLRATNPLGMEGHILYIKHP